MTVGYFARDGQRIDLWAFAQLREDETYRVVKQEKVGRYFVSTVWLGLDHGLGLSAAPLIFETMVFPAAEWEALDMEPYVATGLIDLGARRYSTEEQAVQGHEETVQIIRATSRSIEDLVEEETRDGDH